MSPEQISDLRELFYELDTEKTGSISFEDFKRGLFESKALADASEAQAVFDTLDVSW
jgi:Ca2+-binding EF-hand superfamily protein